jgi:hypothetical protein
MDHIEDLRAANASLRVENSTLREFNSAMIDKFAELLTRLEKYESLSLELDIFEDMKHRIVDAPRAKRKRTDEITKEESKQPREYSSDWYMNNRHSACRSRLLHSLNIGKIATPKTSTIKKYGFWFDHIVGQWYSNQ